MSQIRKYLEITTLGPADGAGEAIEVPAVSASSAGTSSPELEVLREERLLTFGDS